MLSQLTRLQVIKKKRDLPLFAAVGFDLLAGFPRPVTLVSRANIKSETAQVSEGLAIA